MRKAIIVILFAILLSAAFVYAASSDFKDLTGEPSKGGLDISLESFQMKNGTLAEVPELVRIRAGESTSYVPVLTNHGDACQIRLKLYAETEQQKVDILKYCYGFEDRWEQEDGWFYYKKPFEEGERVEICQGFRFPDEWHWKECNILGVTVEAEAVADEVPAMQSSQAEEGPPEESVSYGEGDGDPPRTGDDWHPGRYMIVMLLCLVVLIGVTRRKHGKKDL